MSPTACAFHCSSVGGFLVKFQGPARKVEDGGSIGRFGIFLESKVACGTAAMYCAQQCASLAQRFIPTEGRHYFSWLHFEMEVTLGTDNCALLGCYAASSGNFLLTFRVNLSVPS
jgi:hypothetical protein